MTSAANEMLEKILQEIADDHAHLQRLVARLNPPAGSPISAAEIGRILAALADYANDHFQREEYLMERLRYGGLEQHRLEHLALLDRLSELILAFERGDPQVVSRTQAVMTHWSSQHIPGADERLTAFLIRHYSAVA